jgi:hypothetical protein
MMLLLSIVFALIPQDPANAAKFCAQLRGATAQGHPGLFIFDAGGVSRARKA